MTVYDVADSNLFYPRNVWFIIRYSDSATLEAGNWFSIRNGSYADYPVASFTWNSQTNTVVIILDDEKN
jgi:hypothetical protein